MVKELVTVYQAKGLADAQLWKERLKAEGIKAVIINENANMSYARSIELQVADSNVAHALKILHEVKPIPVKLEKPMTRWLLLGSFASFFIILGTLLLIFTNENTTGPILFIVTGVVSISLAIYATKGK